MEFEIREGVFIGVITKRQWHDRVNALNGDDLMHFKSKCNPFREARDRPLEKTHGFKLVDLLYICKHLRPRFDVDEDFYTIRFVPIQKRA